MKSTNTDENARRNYWREQMDKAYEWMMAIRDYPVEDCGEVLVSLKETVEAAIPGVEVIFSTRKFAHDFDRLYYLRNSLIDPFLGVVREMNRRGWILKVEDAYRTIQMQTQQMRVPYIFDKILEKTIWECHGGTVTPELMERRAAALIAIMPKVGTHMSASALDISVFESDGQTEVDRGAPYLELSELTPMESPFISEKARENRRTISAIFEHHGFVAYPFEFWHYSQGDAYDEYIHGTGKPARYQAIEWDSQTRTIQPCKNPLQALNSIEDIQNEIVCAMKRANI